MTETVKAAFLIYLLMVNLITFAAFGLDKDKAGNRKQRLRESTLLVLALLGGSAGALAGMRIYHHKTKKPKFAVGIPLIALTQVIALILLLMERK